MREADSELWEDGYTITNKWVQNINFMSLIISFYCCGANIPPSWVLSDLFINKTKAKIMSYNMKEVRAS